MNSPLLLIQRILASLLVLIACSSLSYAQSVSIASLSGLIEDESSTISVAVIGGPFNGTLNFGSSNLGLSANSVSFTSAQFNSGVFNTTLQVTPQDIGSFQFQANLTNATSGSLLYSQQLQGFANTSAPSILSKTPSGILITQSATLGLITNEASTCKFDTVDTVYSNMSSTFTSIGSVQHNYSLQSPSQGTHLYYVRCQDQSGHAMNQSATISFVIDLIPSATLSLNRESPLKAGTVELDLVLSESVVQAPILQYSLDGSSTKKSIPLSGTGANYKGYLVITEEDNNKVGTFFFSATDSSQNTGTQLSGDTLFIVDTTKPLAPSSLRSEALANGNIALEWYYDSEETESFNIYRSTSSGVSYVDSYSHQSTSNGTRTYVDKGALNEVTYYYRVSAVDLAGNEGPLSEEVYATSTRFSSAKPSSSSSSNSAAVDSPEVPRVLPPGLVYMVTDQIKKMDKVGLDIDEALTQINSLKDPETARIASDLGIPKRLELAKSSLSSLKSKTSDLKSHYATQDELTSTLNSFDEELRTLEISTPIGLTIKEKGDYVLSSSKDDVSYSSAEVLKTSSLTDAEKKKYTSANIKNQDKVTVSTTAHVISITYLDGSAKDKTLIKKLVSYSEPMPLSDVVVMEFIPKSIAANVNELSFITSNYEVVEEDPIVKFGYLSFNAQGEEIAYTLNKAIALDEIKNSKTVMLLSFNDAVPPSSGITGFAILTQAITGVATSWMWIGFLSIAILGGYYVVSVRGLDSIPRSARRQMDMMKARTLGMGTLRPASHREASRLDDAHPLLSKMYDHIGEAKKNAAQELIPTLFSLHDEISKSHASDELTIQELIHLAHFHADEKNHIKAQQLYSRINALYSALPKERKSDVYVECMKIMQKIASAKKRL